jgi:hypothetical protein
MAPNNSRAAYKTYYDLLDRALDSSNGIRFSVLDEGEGHQFQVMLNKARANDRELNRVSRSSDDPQYGISDYDILVTLLRCEEDGWWVYVRKRVIGRVEELPNDV